MLDGGARIDGRRVKELRRALLLSQRELAQLAGVVTETVNRIERQPERTFRPDTVRHLAKVLGVDPHELMEEERGRRSARADGGGAGRCGKEPGPARHRWAGGWLHPH